MTCGKGTNHSWFPLAFRSRCPFGGSHCPFGGLKGLCARSLLFRRAQGPLRSVLALSAGSRAITLGHCPFGGLKGHWVGTLPFRRAQGPLCWDIALSFPLLFRQAQDPSGINKMAFDWRGKMVLELVERTMLLRINEMEING